MSKARDSVEDLKTLDANLAAKLPKSGGALTGAVTTNSTFDGVAIATRDGILTSTTATANAALPKAGGTMTGVIAGFESTGIDDNATSTAITIDASENVGIGVVPASDWHPSYKALELASSVSLFGNDGASPQTWLCNNMKYDTSTGTTYKQAGFASFYAQLQDGSHQFKVAPSGAADASGTFKNSLNIANNGDISFYEDTGTTAKFFWDASAESLGIGTSSPAGTLQVVGPTGAGVSLSQGSENFYAGSTHRFYSASYAAERMRIDSSGNLLVGKSAIGLANEGFEAQATGQTITTQAAAIVAKFNRLTSDGDINTFYKDGTKVGSIQSRSGVVSTIILDPRTGGAGLTGTGAGMTPTNNVGATSDNLCDLGKSTNRFKDLHLGGGVYLGGTGAAHKLDDYEEGTWTSLVSTSGSNITSLVHTNNYYTKIGRLVTLSFDVGGNISSTGSEVNFRFHLPFSAINSTSQGAGGTANFLIGSGASRFGLGQVFNGTSASATAHVYIPSREISANGTLGGMRVQMTYLTN